MINRKPFEDAYMNLLSNEKYNHLQFYSFVISKMKLNITTKIPTAGAGFYNNTYNLLVNPEFFATLPMEQRIGVLIHECQHVILQHIFRKGERDHKLFNIAADIAINQHIENIPEGGMFPETFEFPEDLTAEHYYTLLKKEQDEQQKEKDEAEKGQDDCPDCGGSGEEPDDSDGEEEGGETPGGEENPTDEESDKGTKPCETCQGSGKEPGENGQWKPSNGHPDLTGSEELTLDDHGEWGKINPEDEELAKDQMGKILEDAQAKARGNTPQNISDLLELWKKKPVISWKRVLKRFVASKKGSKIGTIKRRDRRMPNRHDLKGKKTFYDQPEVVVGIDVSGSMSDDEIMNGLTEILEVCKLTHSKLKVVQIDTDIQGLEVFDEKTKKFERKGCGGTDMSEMARFLTKDKIQYDVLVMISDMYIEDVGTHPDWRLKKPTLWLNTSGADVEWQGTKGHTVMDISQA